MSSYHPLQSLPKDMGVRSTLVLLACLLLMSFTGCAGFGNKVAPTRPGFSAALPVKSTGSPMVSQEIEIGPYKTSAFGPYSILKLAKKKVKPSIQQVSFANDQIQYEYEIATPSGSPVTVQVGSQPANRQDHKNIGRVGRSCDRSSHGCDHSRFRKSWIL